MKKLLLPSLCLLVALDLQAQVDVARRRTLFLETGMAVHESEEALTAYGYFWFNENGYPWTNTALRVIYAGIFTDVELSAFLPSATNTAVGAGAGGGLFLEQVTPYVDGERLAQQSFNGDSAKARIFINQTIPNPTPLPINIRGTYAVSGAFYRDGSSTQNYVLPNDMLIQSLIAEFRLGGMEPGLTATRGAELYLAADVNYRSGFEPFGPVAGLLPAQRQFTRIFGSLGGKIPVASSVLYARVAGGLGDGLDQLSCWKLGGNLVNIEPIGYTLHGYYLRELFATDFGLANLDWAIPLNMARGLTAHLYGDWAVAKAPPPQSSDADHYFGVGCGLGFQGIARTTWLVSYGYGFNAVRNGERGGHEVAVALERKF